MPSRPPPRTLQKMTAPVPRKSSVNTASALATGEPSPSCKRYSPAHCITLTCAHNSCSGPHTCAPGRFTCEAPNCSWRGTFKTKQAFHGDYQAMHLDDRVDCPVEECPRVGAQGIKRADNLAAQMWNKHRISHARLPFRN